jgi:hypothetical protein
LGRVGPKRKKKKVIWVLTTNTSTRGRKKLSVGQRLVVIMVINPYIINIIEQLSLKFYFIYISQYQFLFTDFILQKAENNVKYYVA